MECTERLTIVRFVSIGKRHRVWRWTKPLEGDRGRVSKRDREWYEMVDWLRTDRKHTYPSQPDPRFGTSTRLVYGLEKIIAQQKRYLPLHTDRHTISGNRSCKSESQITKQNEGHATANSWNRKSQRRTGSVSRFSMHQSASCFSSLWSPAACAAIRVVSMSEIKFFRWMFVLVHLIFDS